MTVLPLLFGINVDPTVDGLSEAYERARFADHSGIDLITIQDHPYNRRFFDTWTLLTVLAARTERVHLGTNVASLPLRPPAMLAKQAATLDVISGGRVELGVGAGAYWDGIAALGGPRRSPGEAFEAYRDALHILRGMWDNAGRSFSYEGRFYSVQGAMPGSAPAHRIRIWAGALGNRMLRLTGQMADGWLVSSTYVPVESLPERHARIDAGAKEAGRSADNIRRGYNLMGIIDVGQPGGSPESPQRGVLSGSPRDWIDRLVRYHTEYRLDTFIFWPAGEAAAEQLQVFAEEIVPAVHAAVTPANSSTLDI